ncbi:hypothetical protein [Propionivibrio sp.]|uniref:hypothetical protein n=1 Tax=Propionivibrio sp. TaxID=2212460 RepID=UPI00272E9BB7|nr:hypothetical protein [Propionivibrio sp.]
MRVPDDILFRHYDGRRHQASTDEEGTPPVNGSPASGDALARERRRATPPHDMPDDGENQQNRPNDERRRQEDRRQRQENVLLDTRSRPDRRRSPLYPNVNVKA